MPIFEGKPLKVRLLSVLKEIQIETKHCYTGLNNAELHFLLQTTHCLLNTQRSVDQSKSHFHFSRFWLRWRLESGGK